MKTLRDWWVNCWHRCERVIPTDITADRDAGTLLIAWDDLHRSEFSLPALRWACPCAVCAGEWGQPGKLAGLRILPTDELQLTDLRLVGGYGLTPVWASGHSSGIYSWEYLRSRCPCDQCAASR